VIPSPPLGHLAPRLSTSPKAGKSLSGTWLPLPPVVQLGDTNHHPPESYESNPQSPLELMFGFKKLAEAYVSRVTDQDQKASKPEHEKTHKLRVPSRVSRSNELVKDEKHNAHDHQRCFQMPVFGSLTTARRQPTTEEDKANGEDAHEGRVRGDRTPPRTLADHVIRMPG